MTKDQIKVKVEEHLKNIGINESNLHLDKTMQELNVDSLDVFELCMELEVDFDVTIPDEKIAEMNTPNDLINFVYEILENNND
jgi:acyl carrier protein